MPISEHFAVTSRAAKAAFCFAFSLMMIKLSRGSQFVLYRASRNLELAVDRIEHIAGACYTDIEAHCHGTPTELANV